MSTTPRQYRLLRDVNTMDLTVKAGCIGELKENRKVWFDNGRFYYTLDQILMFPKWFEPVTPVVENEKVEVDIFPTNGTNCQNGMYAYTYAVSNKVPLNRFSAIKAAIESALNPPTTSSIEEEKGKGWEIQNWRYEGEVFNNYSDLEGLVGVEIFSVVRKVDQVVFSIGDEVGCTINDTIFKIAEIQISGNEPYFMDGENHFHKHLLPLRNAIKIPKQPTQQEVDGEHYEIKQSYSSNGGVVILSIIRKSDGAIFSLGDRIYWTYSDGDKNFREDGKILDIEISKSENPNLQFKIIPDKGGVVTKYLSNLNKVHTSQPTFTIDEIKSCCHDDSAGGGCLYLSMDKLLKLGKTK